MKNGYRTVVRVILSILKILRFSPDRSGRTRTISRRGRLRTRTFIQSVQSIRPHNSYLRYAPNDFFIIHN